jgi:hypothetical protein
VSENQLDSSDCEVGGGDDQLCYSERLRDLGGGFGGNGVLMCDKRTWCGFDGSTFETPGASF